MSEQQTMITGELYAVDAVQTFPSGFTKREFVIKTAEKPEYPQFIKLELLKDRTSKLDGLSVGQTIKASFDIQGREHNGKYYNSLICWRLESVGVVPEADQDDLPMDDDNDNQPF